MLPGNLLRGGAPGEERTAPNPAGKSGSRGRRRGVLVTTGGPRVVPVAASSVESIAATAQISLNYARLALAEIEAGDLRRAQGYTALLARRVEALTGALRDHLGGDPLPQEELLRQNPYTDPLDGCHGTMAVHRAILTDEELREYCRYWNWAREQQLSPQGRWWSSKVLSAGQRDLAERGLDPQSWRNGTESE